MVRSPCHYIHSFHLQNYLAHLHWIKYREVYIRSFREKFILIYISQIKPITCFTHGQQMTSSIFSRQFSVQKEYIRAWPQDLKLLFQTRSNAVGVLWNTRTIVHSSKQYNICSLLTLCLSRRETTTAWSEIYALYLQQINKYMKQKHIQETSNGNVTTEWTLYSEWCT